MICDNDPSPNNVNDLEAAKHEYDLLHDYIVRGCIVRSRINWYENGEKNSKYFLNLEKTRRGKTAVRRLYDSAGKITVNPKFIINELRDYYQELYSNHDFEEGEEFASDFLENSNIPTLSNNSMMICEGLLTCAECFEALKKFPNGKSPGNDGLTAEFYKTFWNLLGQQLTDSLNYSFEHGELSTSQKQAIIKLIDKKDRDRRYIKNWRPISLLNVDMKIASKALALRLEKILPEIIQADQYAYVKGRTIFDAIRTIDDIMEFTKIQQLSGLMVAFDFEKAFDSLSWSFLFRALQSFNFGESFIRWVTVLYCNISSCVLNNGFSSQLFDVRRGVRQGDPLSAYLFIIALEVLLVKIRSDDGIKGIVVDKEIKLAAFADDLTTFLRDVNSLENLSATLHRFGICSGLKLNAEKTEALWLGTCHDSDQPLLAGIDKVNKPIKILGVHFTYDLKKKQELNYDDTLRALSETLAGWKWRNLTLYGKIQVVKTFVIPKFMSRASLLCSTKKIIKELNSIIYRFIWKGCDKIKRLALISDYKNGGLRMPHIKTLIDTQRIICLKKYIEDYDSPWKHVLSFFLKDYGGKFFLYCNFNSVDLPDHLPSFYRECLNVWSKLTAKPVESRDEVLKQILWNNQFVRVNGKPVFYKRLFSKGIIFISDILTNYGKLKPWPSFAATGLTFIDFFSLLGIFDSVPSPWRDLINSNGIPTASHGPPVMQHTLCLNGKSFSLDLISSKKLYWELVETIQVYPSARQKYTTLFNNHDLDWETIYVIPHVVTIDTNTRIFQYKILNRILYTNKSLYKMKIVSSPLCTFCHAPEESLEHLFCYCKHSIAFWKSVVLWLKSIDIDIDFLNDYDIIFGLVQKNLNWTLLNHIIIIGKQVIYANRLNNILPFLPQAITKIKYIESIERSIALKNNKLKSHDEKWKPIINFL